MSSPIASPDKPVGLLSSAVGSTSVRLSWSAPSNNGGSSITNYRVRRWVRTSTSSSYVNTDTGTARSLTVTGLSEGGTYTFAVFAQNRVGWSEQSAAIRVELLGRPSAPGGPQLAKITSTSLSAAWHPSSDNGGTAITNYALRVYVGHSASGAFSASYNAISRYRDVTGLTPGETYTFTTLAQNAVGWGPESTPSTITLSRRPDAPWGVSVTDVQATSLTVSWYAPWNTGGPSIIEYLLRIYTGSSASGSYFDIPAYVGTMSVPLDGLSPGQAYTFVVYARNSAEDNGGYSDASFSVTERTMSVVWIRLWGTRHLAIPYVRRNGVWTQAIPYVRTAGVWKVTT